MTKKKDGLVTKTEIYKVIGVTKHRTSQILNGDTKLPFPRPTTHTAVERRPLWSLKDIQEWNEKRRAIPTKEREGPKRKDYHHKRKPKA